MTEIPEKTTKLPGAAERFVLHWGDMGGQWGVNRSISQIHALLYLSERPRTAEEIAAVLGLARSNVFHLNQAASGLESDPARARQG